MLAFTFTITLGWWLVPVILTAIMCFFLFRPIKHTGGGNDWGMGNAILTLTRLFWLIPILAVWVVYLAIKVIF